MKDIRWRVFWLIISLSFVCLIVWAAKDAETALITFSIVITLYLFHHLFWLDKLLAWYKKPDLNAMPLGNGAWEDVFATNKPFKIGEEVFMLLSLIDDPMKLKGAVQSLNPNDPKLVTVAPPN